MTSTTRTMRWLSIAAIALSCSIASAKVFVLDFSETAPAGQMSLSELPERPQSFVVDERNELTALQRDATEHSLATSTNRPVYVLIKSGELPVPAETYANELLRRWGSTTDEVSALLFSVEQPLPTIHLAIAKRDLDETARRELQTLGREVLAAMPSQSAFAPATAEAGSKLVAEFAKLELSSPQAIEATIPTYPQGTPEKSLVATQPAPGSHWEALSAKLNWPLIRGISGVIGSLFILIGGIVIICRIRQSTGLMLPEHLPRKRFGGPVAGGSNAIVSYSD